MNRYVVFVTEDEKAWEAKTSAERQEVYDADGRFVRLLDASGEMAAWHLRLELAPVPE
jgi:hypothetical protein